MIDKQIATYIDRFSEIKIDENLSKIKEYANTNQVPIIYNDVAKFIQWIFATRDFDRILEIGTAIGYSGIIMLDCSKAHLDTIEISIENYEIARANFEIMKLSNRVSQYLGDASNVLTELQLEVKNDMKKHYDFVFIDAAKAQYLDYFIKIEKMLSKDAIVMFDNILYKGIVAGLPHIRRNNTIERRINELLEYIDSKKIYTSSLLSIGDGVLLISNR